MNIFGVGGAELVLIIVIMLVVAGPKRMVRWAYVAGEYIGKLRHMWAEVVDVMQREIDDAGLDVKLPSEPPTRQNIDQWARSVAKPFTEDLENAAKDIEKTTAAATAAVKDVQKTTRDAVASTKQTNKSNGTAKAQPAKPTEEKNAAPPKKESAPAQDANFGSWGGANQPTTEPPANDTSFGAWGNPRKTGQQDNGTGATS